jgi:hypothetical protein
MTFLFEINNIKFIVPGEGTPDFSGISEPTLSILQASWESENYSIMVAGESVVTPNWDALRTKCLTPGDPMNDIYNRLTLAAMQEGANSISTAQNKIESAILTIRIEGVLAAGIALLTNPLPPSGTIPYTFTQEEKDIWNPAVTSLGFSPLVYI